MNTVQLEALIGARILDISTSAAWLSQLRDALASPTAVIRLDMGGVEKVDTACLQAFAAFVRAAQQQRKTLEWSACSDAFKMAAEDLGLHAALSVEYGKAAN